MSIAAITNPHSGDAEREAIWQMLMTRDFEAFAAQDWSVVARDFLADGFFGVDGGCDRNIRNWKPRFPNLGAYKKTWLEQAAETAGTADMSVLVADLLEATSLGQIDIDGDFAVAHKMFDGHYHLKDGSKSPHLLWQTLYLCRKTAHGWKISGFVGYLPNPLTPKNPA